MPEVAYVNGQFMPIGEAVISIEDRSVQFGDSVYEVVVSYGGDLFLWERHLARLRQSTTAIGLAYDFDGAPLEPIVREGLERSGFADAMVYIQLTRGTAPRSHVPPPSLVPSVIMTFKPRPIVPPELSERGARIVTAPDTRWANCFIKATTLLPNILARSDANARGCNEALFVSGEGEVRECTSSNVFIVCGGELIYPPRTESVLRGVTQGFILECAVGLGIATHERAFNVETLRGADEAFLSSTAVEALGVTSVDGQAIGDGAVGPVTRRISEEFARRVRAGVTTGP